MQHIRNSFASNHPAHHHFPSNNQKVKHMPSNDLRNDHLKCAFRGTSQVAIVRSTCNKETQAFARSVLQDATQCASAQGAPAAMPHHWRTCARCKVGTQDALAYVRGVQRRAAGRGPKKTSHGTKKVLDGLDGSCRIRGNGEGQRRARCPRTWSAGWRGEQGS